MTQVIDRRLNGRNKSTVNRQRFIRRFKAQIRAAAAEAIGKRSVTDLASGQKITIPRRDIAEPEFRLGPGGRRETVHPGNREFLRGDRIERPDGAEGAPGPGAPGDQEGGEDTFTFELTRDEFLDCFFEDLELPDLVKTQLKAIIETRPVRAGYSRDGVPANIAVTRTLRQALGRRIALRGPYAERLRKARDELEELEDKGLGGSVRAEELREEIARLDKHLKAIPFIDSIDLRYHNRVQEAVPRSQAVMFCLMDVSGSMDEPRKDMAKRFFLLLYLFLTRAYERIEVVFIRHHVSAKEVDEHEFFHSRETGGTIVSSALEKVIEVIADRFPVLDWNIYVAQASDGENWGNDSARCADLMRADILPKVQFFAYVEVGPRAQSELREAYESLLTGTDEDRLAIQTLDTPADIYPVFRRFLVPRERLAQ